MNSEGTKRILVKQIRSSSGRTVREKETLKSLGLGAIGKKKEHNATGAVLGMIRKVEHIVTISLV